MADSGKTLFEKNGNIATITINRPEVYNALDHDVNTELLQHFEAVGGDDAVRAVVLTGAGKAFCSGADVSIMASGITPDQLGEFVLKYYKPLIPLIHELDKPVVCAMNGVAAGIGASLALACDLKVMSEEASLMLAFSNIGLVPDGGASWFYARQLGYSRALQLAIEAEKLSADRALDYGMVNKVAPAGEVLSTAQDWAEKLANRPTVTLGLTKKTMRFAMENGLEETIVFEAQTQKRSAASEDHKEGVRAFLEKRRPNFSGK